MPEYTSEGMETVRQGAGQARKRCLFKVTVQSSRAVLCRELWGVYSTQHNWALGHWPTASPSPLDRAALRGINCSQSHFLLLLCTGWASSRCLWLKVERGSVHWSRIRIAANGSGCTTAQLSHSWNQTWMARMWQATQKGLIHIDTHHNPCLLLPPHDFCATSVESNLVISFQIKNIHTTWSRSSDSRDLPHEYSCSCVKCRMYNDVYWSIICNGKQLGGKISVSINMEPIK